MSDQSNPKKFPQVSEYLKTYVKNHGFGPRTEEALDEHFQKLGERIYKESDQLKHALANLCSECDEPSSAIVAMVQVTCDLYQFVGRSPESAIAAFAQCVGLTYGVEIDSKMISKVIAKLLAYEMAGFGGNA